jgi:hypothetical protein
LAAGGSKGELAIWDTEENENIAKHYKVDINNKAAIQVDDDIEDEENEEVK